ncbi:hypothetical protein C8R44DRAFT_871909 [Mycena epipterygia]|nr:hypothetical protein C8R44DRAFT_871909 [Mycena epipterygia]
MNRVLIYWGTLHTKSPTPLHDYTISSAVFKTFAIVALFPFATVMAADDQLQPTCGVAEDAKFSDCQTLVNNDWANFDYSRTCTFRNAAGIYSGKPWELYVDRCPGCIYVSNEGYQGQPDALKYAVNKILGCASTAKDKVNGAIKR